MQELTLPKLGQSMDEGLVLEWLFDEGDDIAKGDPVLLIETDKASSEVAATEDGTLFAKLVAEGETVPVGTTLGYIGASGDELPDDASSIQEGMGRSDQNISDRDGASDSESSVRNQRNSRKPPDKSASATGNADPDNEISPVRSSPTARRVAREEGISIEEVGQEFEIQQVTTDHVEKYVEAENTEQQVLASPYARKIAAERDVDIEHVGTQLDTTRVRVAHVEKFLETLHTPRDSTGELSESTPVGKYESPSVRTDQPIDGAGRVMFKRMSQVASEYCTTTTVAKVDVTNMLRLQERLAEAWTRSSDVSPSLTAFVMAAVSKQLPEYPELNAELISDEKLRLFDDVNVGIAVNTDSGLLVPTVYHTPSKSVKTLSKEIAELARRSRNGELSYDEMQNGTFTISNAGSLGTYMNTPKILPPQTAILGLCAVFDEVEIIDDELQSREKVHLCLTYDHRVVEGAIAVGFLQSVKSLLETPEALLE